jgi:hypothetical protein
MHEHDPDEPEWYSVGPTPEDDEPDTWSVAPGVHVTINQAPPKPANHRAEERRARTRRWLLVHGAAGGVGWYLGLGPSMAALLDTSGPGAPFTGLALAGMTYVAAELVTERLIARYVPSDHLRRAAAWVARIPFATALLATALHAPTGLI